MAKEMRKILVIFESDNGYDCSCCRTEWVDYSTYEVSKETDTEIFIDDLVQTLKDLYNNDGMGRSKILGVFEIGKDFNIEVDLLS